MKQLIVNADDFGLTPGVNRAIIECHTRGIVTSATLMANSPAFDDAVLLVRENPSLGAGLHFNITEGRPIASASRVRSLLDEQDEFLGASTALAKRAILGRLRIEEVVVELRAQIEKALSAGIELTHVDSHKHSHALPAICEAIAGTINEYGINAMRLPRESWCFDPNAGSFKLIGQSLGALALSQLCRAGEAKLRKADVRTTQAFFGITRTGFWDKQWLMDLIGRLPDGVSELMCHPGYDDDELGRVKTRLRQSRVNELRLLTDPDVIARLKEHGVRLIDFSDL